MTAKPFPWSREVWAILLDKLCAAGARLVMFDFVFSPPNEGDPIFRESLEKNRIVSCLPPISTAQAPTKLSRLTNH